MSNSMEELLNTGLSTKVTFKTAVPYTGNSFGRDCNKESSFIIPSLIFLEMASSTADDIFPSKALTTLE
jgi:hypothetical protein